MRNYSKLTPEGTRDVLFEASEAQSHIEKRLRTFFYCRGFREVRTPGIEFFDVFGSAGKYFPAESMYKLSDRNGRLIVMRPDSTIPMARLVATKYKNKRMPLRICYDQTVYRTSRNLDGISHEMRQMGVEVIGGEGPKSDMEILKMACDVFTTIDMGEDFRLEIGHVGIFKTLVDHLDIDELERDTLFAAVEEKNYSALNDILERHGDKRAAHVLRQLPRLFGGRDTLEQARAVMADLDPAITAAIDQLAWIYDQFEALGYEDNVMIDLGLINQADYYSGLIFRGYIGGAGLAVLSGGRYDHLLDDFDMQAAAIGFGVRVDQLAEVLLKKSPVFYSRLDLVYADEKDMPQAFQWMAARKMCAEWSLAATLEEAIAEAKERDIPTVIHYHDGNAEWLEV
ncbi:MAG: ATP phosphoribosyltransferase regulatory subunit [Peptococcaceae bacterium]|nr:ATP phosphoribosyltransferase regulatory subunit [Peptococcaceae bacterium]